MKRNWKKIMIVLLLLTGFALLPKERSRSMAGVSEKFLSVYGMNDTIKIQIVGYDKNLNTTSSSLTADDIITTPSFVTKSLSSAETREGSIVYVLTLTRATLPGDVVVDLPANKLVDADGNKNSAVSLKTNARVGVSCDSGLSLMKDR